VEERGAVTSHSGGLKRIHARISQKVTVILDSQFDGRQPAISWHLRDLTAS